MTDQLDEQYLNRVATTATRLRRLADDVEKLAKPSYSHGRLDYVAAAIALQRKVLLELQMLGLEAIINAAVEAAHPTARYTPGQLLDRGATAAAEAADRMQEADGSSVLDWPGFDCERMADGVLRGAGLL